MHNVRLLTMTIAGVSFAFAGFSDTVTFSDGSTLDGDVNEINENCVELTANGETLLLQRTEFASFEHNEKKGDPGKPLAIPIVAQWEKEMQARTGLNSEDREKVCALLDALVRVEGAEDRKRLERDLVELNKKVDVIKFIKATFEDSGISQQMQRLEAYLVLDPVSALPLVQKGLVTAFPPMRERAVRGYVSIKQKAGKFDKEAVKYFARGMIDPDLEVRISSGHALAEAGDKAATPVLLASLGAADPRLRNVADMALARVWGMDPATLPQDRKTFWNAYWKTNGSTVAGPLTP
mgnify:FL=1